MKAILQLVYLIKAEIDAREDDYRQVLSDGQTLIQDVEVEIDGWCLVSLVRTVVVRMVPRACFAPRTSSLIRSNVK